MVSKSIKLLIVFGGLLLAVGCSDGKPKEKSQTGGGYDAADIDHTIFESDKLLTVKGYEVDSSARIYTLNECSKLVKQGTQTPKHCLNAATAEYDLLIADIEGDENSETYNPLSAEEKKELKREVILNSTFGEM